MRRLVIPLTAVVATSLLLSGCGSAGGARDARSNADRGIAVLPPEVTSYIASDAARKLSGLLLPAKTPLRLARPPAGGFAKAVADALRAEGYAVAEPASAKQAVKEARDSAAVGQYSDGLFSTPPLAVTSRLMRVEADLHVARIDLGDRRISRAYVVTPEGATPAGAWTYKE